MSRLGFLGGGADGQLKQESVKVAALIQRSIQLRLAFREPVLPFAVVATLKPCSGRSGACGSYWRQSALCSKEVRHDGPTHRDYFH